jgi:hypothetical protein
VCGVSPWRPAPSGAPPPQLATPSQSGLRSPDPGVIDLDLAMRRLTGRIDHGAPQLVQEHPGRFIPAKPELPLQQERGHTAGVRDGQIRRPEPQGERRLGVVENRPGGERGLVPARLALPSLLLLDAVCAPVAAARTRKSIRPATRAQIVLTGRLGRETPLEIEHIPRKRGARHAHTRPIVACLNNRIIKTRLDRNVADL